MKATIDIEALLVWAYRNQCVDRMAGQMDAVYRGEGPTMRSASSVLANQIALGCRVDSQPRQVAFLGAKAPDDALVVHDAVLALGDVFVELGARDYTLWDHSLAEREGASIDDCAAGGWLLTRPDAAPARLERIVLTVELIRHAKAADRPDVYADWSIWGDGRLHHKETRGADRGLGVAVRDVLRARAVYGAWRLAMLVLAADLREALTKWEPMAPAVPESPWEVSGVIPRRVEKRGVSVHAQPIDIVVE